MVEEFATKDRVDRLEAEIRDSLKMHGQKHEDMDKVLSSIQISVAKLVTHAENEEKLYPLSIRGFEKSIDIVKESMKEQSKRMDKQDERMDKQDQKIENNTKKIWYAAGAIAAIAFLIKLFT